MRKILGHGWLALVLVLIPGAVLPQASQESGVLTVSGHPGEVPVTQINGRPYVAVDALAQLMNGSLGYQGSRITLKLPGRRARRVLFLLLASLRIRHFPEIF